MNTLDIIILVCLAPGIISGIRKGFISQVVSIVSLVLGIWAAFKFSAIVGEWIGSWLNASASVINVIAFVVIFLAIALALNLIGKVIEKTLKAVALGWTDKLLGIAFALVKYLLIVGLLILVFNEINMKFSFVAEETLDNSVLFGPIRDLAYKIFPYLKEALTQNAAPAAEAAAEAAEAAVEAAAVTAI